VPVLSVAAAPIPSVPPPPLPALVPPFSTVVLAWMIASRNGCMPSVRPMMTTAAPPTAAAARSHPAPPRGRR
jgi:hypothetical protein